VAIFTVALHAALWGIAPRFSALPVDPFSVICHSEASAPGNAAPIQGPLPSAPCDHCILCSAVTPPVPPEMIHVTWFKAAQTFQVLRPFNIARHASVAADPKLARGPPAIG